MEEIVGFLARAQALEVGMRVVHNDDERHWLGTVIRHSVGGGTEVLWDHCGGGGFGAVAAGVMLTPTGETVPLEVVEAIQREKVEWRRKRSAEEDADDIAVGQVIIAHFAALGREEVIPAGARRI